jgi:hypothetical protein
VVVQSRHTDTRGDIPTKYLMYGNNVDIMAISTIYKVYVSVSFVSEGQMIVRDSQVVTERN